MTVLDMIIIGLLVVAWAWGLGTPLLARRLGSLRPERMGTFHRQLGALSRRRLVGQEAPLGTVPPVLGRQQAARRRQIFLSLVISVVVSLLLAVTVGDIFVALHVTMDCLLVSYVALAVITGREQRQRRARVVPIRPNVMADRRPAYVRAAGDA